MRQFPPPPFRRPVLAGFSAVFLFVSATLAAALTVYFDHKTNVANSSPVYISVTLVKSEKNQAGEETGRPVPGAKFWLFTGEGALLPPKDGDNDYYETDVNGRAQLFGLLPGSYYFWENECPSGYTPDLDPFGVEIRRYDFTLTGKEFVSSSAPPAEQVVFVSAYNRRAEGELQVSKSVVRAELSDAPPPDEPFSFTVTFSESARYPCVIGETTLTPSSPAFSVSFSLAHGQTALFPSLPAGIRYTVTEQAAPGFLTRSTGSQGVIAADTASQAAFINYRTAQDTAGSGEDEPTNGGLVLRNTVINSDGSPLTPAQRAEGFDYTVTAGGETYMVTLRHGETFELPALPGGTPYTVTAQPREGYATNIGTFSGTIVAGETELLHAIRQRGGDAPSPGTASLTVVKRVEGAGFDPQAEFSFTLRVEGAQDEGFTLRSGESRTFDNLPAGAAYAVAEQDAPGYTLKAAQNASGTLFASVTAVFTNALQAHKPTPPVGAVSKQASVGVYTPGQSVDYTVAFTLPPDISSYSAVAVTDSYTFGELSFQSAVSLTVNGAAVALAPGDTDSSQDGVVSVALAAEHLTPSAQVELILRFLVTGGGPVTNTVSVAPLPKAGYEPPAPSPPSSAPPSAPPPSPPPDSDTAVIVPSGGQWHLVTYDPGGGEGRMPDDAAQNGEAYTVKDSAFYRDGHTFAGWQSGGAVYLPGDTLLVTGDVTLTALWSPLPTPASYVISGAKLAEGPYPAPLPAFTFLLERVYHEEEPPDPAPPPLSALSRSDGSFAFPPVTLAEGTHYFKVTESPHSFPGWSHDPTTYFIAVTVVSSGGRLTVESAHQSPPYTAGIIFTNVYSPEPSFPGMPQVGGPGRLFLLAPALVLLSIAGALTYIPRKKER
ncbi:MAG: DUF5979 domain-containing protein [Oscillospiraceae bacterium]|jgi:uncharacterized repeat protein (TIGR02543 family)|nr:DUF5979 domain-containing protein [Oscillospiraceae bacterium]